MDTKELKEILTKHKLWLENKDGGQRADLSGADLRGADLRDANLRDANLRDADLSDTILSGADLRGANLSGAYLYGVDLRYTNLYGVDLRGAILRAAILHGADLRYADLSDARLPHFQITPVGYPLIGFKKLSDGSVCVLEVPLEAERTASLVGRKCRAEFVKVLEGSGSSGSEYGGLQYSSGSIVYPDRYDDDIRVECTNGIHFFLTREEAEQW